MSTTSKNLTILGATGSVGRELLSQALAAGHKVTVLVRNPEKLGELRSRVTVIQGDVTDADAIDRAVVGNDAVLNALGHAKGSPDDIFAVTASKVIASMRRHSVRRIVVLGNTSIHDASDQPTPGQKFQGVMMGLMIGQVNRDHEAQARLIVNSGLDWTIVRAATLADGPRTSTYRVGNLDQKAGNHIARANAADFMLACLADDKYIHSMPVVSE